MVVKAAFDSTGRTGRKKVTLKTICVGLRGNFAMQTSHESPPNEAC